MMTILLDFTSILQLWCCWNSYDLIHCSSFKGNSYIIILSVLRDCGNIIYPPAPTDDRHVYMTTTSLYTCRIYYICSLCTILYTLVHVNYTLLYTRTYYTLLYTHTIHSCTLILYTPVHVNYTLLYTHTIHSCTCEVRIHPCTHILYTAVHVNYVYTPVHTYFTLLYIHTIHCCTHILHTPVHTYVRM